MLLSSVLLLLILSTLSCNIQRSLILPLLTSFMDSAWTNRVKWYRRYTKGGRYAAYTRMKEYVCSYVNVLQFLVLLLNKYYTLSFTRIHEWRNSSKCSQLTFSPNSCTNHFVGMVVCYSLKYAYIWKLIK